MECDPAQGQTVTRAWNPSIELASLYVAGRLEPTHTAPRVFQWGKSYVVLLVSVGRHYPGAVADPLFRAAHT